MIEWIMTDVALWLGRMILVGMAVVFAGAGVVLAAGRFDWWLACKDQQARELDAALGKPKPGLYTGPPFGEVVEDDGTSHPVIDWDAAAKVGWTPPADLRVPPEALDPRDRDAFGV